MFNLMEYRGLSGKINFDPEQKMFCGEVMEARTFLSFAGETVSELETSFHQVVDGYMEFCAEQNIQPEKSWKGKLTFRPRSDAMRQQIAIVAATNDVSVNEWLNEAVEKALYAA